MNGAERPRPEPAGERLTVLYRDESLIAVDKPAGLLVHRSLIDRHETRYAIQTLRDQIGRRVYPVHRLDKPTSGVLLFALDPATARRVGETFEAGRVAKRYLAVVRGHTDEQGVIDYPLKEQLDRMTDVGVRPDKPAQPAVTAYRRLATVELPWRVDRYPTSRYSLLELRPRTGRKHQLRRHLKHIAHPIVGDTTHGKARHNRLFQEQFGNDRLLLAAVRLSLPHPVDGHLLDIAAPLTGAFARVVERLGWGAEAADYL